MKTALVSGLTVGWEQGKGISLQRQFEALTWSFLCAQPTASTRLEAEVCTQITMYVVA